MAESGVRIGVLRGRENSFPDAFVAKVNSIGKGVTAEFVHLGGTKLNEPVPYRVILDRMSHEVPYYSVYLKMAALQGTYCINNVFWRTADDKFFGYAAAEKLGIAEPKTVVLPNRSYVDDVTAESLRNLWPTDFSMYLDYVGCPCIMKPAFGGGWKNVNKIHSLDELMHHYNESGTLTLMLQEFISWDTYIRVPTIGRRWARAIRYDPAPGGMGGYNQDYDILPRALRDKAEELSLQYNVALGYDMNALEFAVKDGKYYGIDLTNYTPDLDYRSLKDAHFPWAVEKMATFAIEKALSKESTPKPPDWKSLLLQVGRQRPHQPAGVPNSSRGKRSRLRPIRAVGLRRAGWASLSRSRIPSRASASKRRATCGCRRRASHAAGSIGSGSLLPTIMLPKSSA